jgi:hypothetical protein
VQYPGYPQPQPSTMNQTLYRALEWLLAHPESSARSVAAGIGDSNDRYVFKLLDNAAYKGLCQRARTGTTWLWEVPEGAPLAEHGGPARLLPAEPGEAAKVTGTEG